MADNDSLNCLCEKFIKDFHGMIDVATYTKLLVIMCRESKPREIKKHLYHMLSEYNNDHHFSQFQFKSEIDLYNSGDNNKINRLLKIFHNKKKKNSLLLIQAIHLSACVKIILTKYPQPDLAGLPYCEWTPLLLKKFICIYFELTDKEIEKSTVASALYKATSHHGSQISISAKNFDLYYVYICLQRLKTENMDSASLARRYNRVMYVQLLHINKEMNSFIIEKVGPIIRKKYNYQNRYQNLSYYELVARFSKRIDQDRTCCKKPILLFNKEILSASPMKSYKNKNACTAIRTVLKKTKKMNIPYIPSYSALFVNNCRELYSVISDFEQFDNVISTLQNVTCDTIKKLPKKRGKILKSDEVEKIFESYEII